MIRVLCLAGGLACGAGLSQFPEFSQQYLQRLAGQVDVLTLVVKDFDASALAAGMGREEALEQMTGTPFLDRRQLDMRRTFARHARLSENLILLRQSGPLGRLTQPHRMSDTDLLQATWGDFTPALPISVAGAASAGTGFVTGWALLAGCLAVVLAPFRRNRAKRGTPPTRAEPALRRDPPINRPTLVATPADNRPRLAGVKR